MSTVNRDDWEYKNLYSQVLLYLACFGFFINALMTEQGRNSMLFYFGFSTVWLILAALNSIIAKRSVSQFISLTVIIVNTFVIPFALYSYGTTVGVAALGSIIYIIFTIAISPIYVGLSAACAGVYFSFIQKKYYVTSGDDSEIVSFIYITAAYISLIVLALCWRFLIHRMYRLLSSALTSIQAAKSDDVSLARKRYDDLLNEQQLLKEEMALHIMELNEITGYN